MTAPSRGPDAAEPDEVLMARLQRGEDAALGELMARWEMPVKAFLLRVGVPAADVEDVAQETFVRLYAKRASYRTGAPVKAWLLTMAVNLGRNRLRWRWRRREEPWVGEETVALATDDPSGAEVAEIRDRAQTVREAVSRLPQRLREVVICVEFEALNHAEAAAVLGCTVKAVETRLYRARRTLRRDLAGWLA